MNEFLIPAEYDRSNCKFNSRDSEKEKHPLSRSYSLSPFLNNYLNHVLKTCVSNIFVSSIRMTTMSMRRKMTIIIVDIQLCSRQFLSTSISFSSSYITLRIIYRSFSIQLSNIHILLSSGFDRHQRFDHMFNALCKTNRDKSEIETKSCDLIRSDRFRTCILFLFFFSVGISSIRPMKKT